MAACASRSRQSPINLNYLDAPTSMNFRYAYQPIASPVQLKNNGHAYSVEVAGLGVGGVTYDSAWYDLLTINVHAESEHTFGGRHTPLELHLVHKRYDGNAVLIVAIPFDVLNVTAAGISPVLQTFLKVSPVDLNSLMSGSSKYFEYAGSLSAPPCAEVATWLVRREPLAAPELQVRALHDAVFAATSGHGNFRATMPLNGRTVALREAVAEDAPAASPQEASSPSAMSIAVEGREARAERWAEDALRIARVSADYVRDLDRRVHTIAEAHANVLAPLGQEAPGPGGVPIASSASRPLHAHGAAGPAPAHAAETAEALRATVAAAAKEAVADAVGQIAAQTRAAALQAAQDAARAVVQDIAAGRFPAQPGGPPPA